jgi:hypothetical protein
VAFKKIFFNKIASSLSKCIDNFSNLFNRREPPEEYGEAQSDDPSLAVTEELLSLLEDFKQKSYSLHEMEALFENWRRKAEVST